LSADPHERTVTPHDTASNAALPVTGDAAAREADRCTRSDDQY
jgi:hypothetical protein